MSKRITYNPGDTIINDLIYLGEAGWQDQKDGTRKRLLKVQCHCGNIFNPRMNDLRSGKVKSCGCIKAESTRKAHTTHGFTKNRKQLPLYVVWKGMKKRCLNPNEKQYHDYGGRGIVICDEWKNDAKSFVEWAMANGYEKGLEIDRIDVNGNYEPSNCRFVTSSVNSQNTRLLNKLNKSGYRGVHKIKDRPAYKAKINANGKRIELGYFRDKIDAARAYDRYVVENGLEHPINGV